MTCEITGKTGTVNMRTLILGAAALLLAACGDATEQPVATGADPAPEVEADPTPQTGTGGSVPTATPDGAPQSAPTQPLPGETPQDPPVQPAPAQ